MLLTGPFGGLTDDVREFLLCLADEGLPLTGWGDLDQAGLHVLLDRVRALGLELMDIREVPGQFPG